MQYPTRLDTAVARFFPRLGKTLVVSGWLDRQWLVTVNSRESGNSSETAQSA